MRYKIFIYFMFYIINVYSQKKEIEFLFNPTIFFKIENAPDIQMAAHYKYLPYIKYLPFKSPFILATGVEFLQDKHNWEGFKMQKLIIPFALNFSIGNHYRLYGGIGIYGSFNLNQVRNIKMKPTIFQTGRIINMGFQLKIKNKSYFNTELKYIRDLSPTYIDISPNPKGDDYVKNFSINVGLTYRLTDISKKE